MSSSPSIVTYLEDELQHTLRDLENTEQAVDIKRRRVKLLRDRIIWNTTVKNPDPNALFKPTGYKGTMVIDGKEEVVMYE